MKKQVPVGAAWQALDIKTGSVGRVWLARRESFTNRTGSMETWKYQFMHKDGSGPPDNWAPSYAKAVELCKLHFPVGTKGLRFYRQAELMEDD